MLALHLAAITYSSPIHVHTFTVYTRQVLTISKEQRRYLKLDGAPLPLIDAEVGHGYMLMPVTFSRGPGRTVLARVPGVRAVGEADLATEALATLAILIKENLHRL